jgi:hypothetical protein
MKEQKDSLKLATEDDSRLNRSALRAVQKVESGKVVNNGNFIAP